MLTTGRNTVRSHRGLGACHMGTAPGDGGSGPSRIGEGTELDRLGTFMTKAEMEVDETWQQWNPLLRGSQLRFQYRGVTIDLLLPRDRHDQAIFDGGKRSVSADSIAGSCRLKILFYRS